MFLKSSGRSRVSRLVLPLLTASVLAACGGGGDSVTDPAVETLTAPLASTSSSSSASMPESGGELMISEIATNYYSDDVAWFEVYNPSSSPVSLADYTLRSSHIDLDTRVLSYTPAHFSLPDALVPARGYLVVAAKVTDALNPNSQMVFVRDGRLVPFWTGHGSVELLKDNQTVDFVRFGYSPTEPTRPGSWSGSSAPGMPIGANEHGKSIVRLLSAGMPDTDTGSDWAFVNFATPAGQNDVEPGVVDSDNDGIPDSAKRYGGTYAGIDLYARGARPGRRDVFVEVDYMRGSDPALLPRREALQKVKDAFAARGIALHFDTGSLYGEQINPANFNLGGGNPVEFASCIELATGGSGARTGCTSFYDYKARHFDVRRNLVFHYTMFASSLRNDGAAGSSGVAELNGNDLIVSLGGYGLSTSSGVPLNMLINLQAGTLMHELGHNLGLRHGGNEDRNYKPNHYSVMNYMYQFAGLSATPDSVHAAERYYLANGLKSKTFCNLVENSPCSADFRVDYSDGAGQALDENNLFEASNIGRGAVPGAYADWDNNSIMTATRFARDINHQDGTGRTVLRDYDEWSNLKLGFARGRSGNNYGSNWGETGATSQTEEQRANPMNQRARIKIQEPALPSALIRDIREARAYSDRGHEYENGYGHGHGHAH